LRPPVQNVVRVSDSDSASAFEMKPAQCAALIALRTAL